MDKLIPQLPRQTIDGGDRVHIQQGGKRLLPDLVGRAGTVVEVFRIPLNSCLVRIDGDLNRDREWFFYQDEVVSNDAHG